MCNLGCTTSCNLAYTRCVDRDLPNYSYRVAVIVLIDNCIVESISEDRIWNGSCEAFVDDLL